MEKRSLPLKTQRDTLRNEWNDIAWPVVEHVYAAPLCCKASDSTHAFGHFILKSFHCESKIVTHQIQNLMSKKSRVVLASLRVAMAASELIIIWKHIDVERLKKPWKHHVIAIRPTQLIDYSMHLAMHSKRGYPVRSFNKQRFRSQ